MNTTSPFDRLTRGALLAWGIWTPRVALLCGLLCALSGFRWTACAASLALCILVALGVDRPIQRAARKARHG